MDMISHALFVQQVQCDWIHKQINKCHISAEITTINGDTITEWLDPTIEERKTQSLHLS